MISVSFSGFLFSKNNYDWNNENAAISHIFIEIDLFFHFLAIYFEISISSKRGIIECKFKWNTKKENNWLDLLAISWYNSTGGLN